MHLVAAVAATAALWAAWPQSDRRLLRRLASAPEEEGRGHVRRARSWAPIGVALAVALGLIVGGPRGGALAFSFGILGAALFTLARRGRRRRQVEADRMAVAAAAEGLCGLLRVGAIPAAALSALATEQPVLAEAAAEHAIGGDVVAALRRSASRPGREGLSELAAAWEVAARTGASMESAIDVIADDLHERQERAATVRIELAASRMASRLLGGLPLAGIALGYAFGGDPVAFLTGNPVGLACLAAAAALASVGLVWTDTLAERAGG